MNKYTFTYPIRMDGEIEVMVNALSDEEAKVLADSWCQQRDIFNNTRFKSGTIRFDKRQLKRKVELPPQSYTYSEIIEESKKSRDGLEFLTEFNGVWFEVTIDRNGELDSIRTRGSDCSYWHEVGNLDEREQALVRRLPELGFNYLQEVGE